MKELCPFCGSPGKISKIWFAASWRYYPECSGCGVRPQGRKDSRLGYGEWQPHFTNITMAENLWNNRHLTTQPTEICICKKPKILEKSYCTVCGKDMRKF